MGSPGCDWANLAANRSRAEAPPKTKMIFFSVAFFDDVSEAWADFVFFGALDNLEDERDLVLRALVEGIGCSNSSSAHPPIGNMMANTKLAAIRLSRVMWLGVPTQRTSLLVQVEKYIQNQILRNCDRKVLRNQNLSPYRL